MKLNRIFSLFIILIAIVAFQACSSDVTEQSAEAIKVAGKKITLTEISEPIEFSGNVEGVQRVKLSTKLMGTITYFPFKAGAKIEKGQVLAKINSSDLLAKKQQVKASIAQAEAALNNMTVNYNRVKSLFEKKSATAKEMEDIQMAYDMATAQANAAREMEMEINDVLSYAVIKAPFSGYIVNKYFEEGDLTAPGHPLMIVENFSAFKIKASVSGSDIKHFEKGDAVIIELDEVDGTIFSGKLDAINAGAHPASRQYDVEVMIDSENLNLDQLKSGMYAKISLQNFKRKMIAVESSDLIERGQLRGVYTLSMSNEVLLRWLRLGNEVDGKIEVLAGLREGDVIILDKNVREGQKVEVVL